MTKHFKKKCFFVYLTSLSFTVLLLVSIHGPQDDSGNSFSDLFPESWNGMPNTNKTEGVSSPEIQRLQHDAIDSDKTHYPDEIDEVQPQENFVGISSSIPLDDFKKYPCLKGLPIFPKAKWLRNGKCVRTVNITENGDKTTKHCVPLKSQRGTTPICIYPAQQDKWVSASLEKDGEWEGDLVEKLALLLKSHPGLEFLDIGCNIGAYSVSIAHQGTRVTAIDPMTQNLELLSHSLTLGNLHENVTLIWNAVSNTHNTVKFRLDRNNVGGTRIEDFVFSPSAHRDVDLARAITLDDLIPLFQGRNIVVKMDIEETEYNALLGGSTFLNEVNIIAIQMEFSWHKKGIDGPKIVEFLSSKGFRPYKELSKNVYLNISHMLTWPSDIYFMKH